VDITGLDALALSAALRARRVGCVEVMTAVLDRIERVNPLVNAIVSLRPRDELLAEAHAADHAEPRGWLHGVPFAVKDLVETAGLRTTRGSPLFADHVPAEDELLACRIRATGAILIGKTNTPEFGMGSHSYNPVHGVTRNPYDLSKSAGGSSGGAAAALAARLVPVADGSDMMGSLRNPAAFCNVYGFRPTVGRIPDNPAGETFFRLLSTDGPMARTPRDLAALLDSLAGPDPRCPHALPVHPSFLAAIDAPVRGRRIGWIGDWRGHFSLEAGILDLCGSALEVFERLGAVVETVVPDFDPEALWSAWTTLRSFAIAGAQRQHHEREAERALLKPEAVWEIERGLALSAMEVHAASAVRSDWFRCLAALFDRYDALALPSAAVFPFPAEWHWPRRIGGRTMDTYHRWMEVVIPASLAGVPAVAVPAGFGSAGLPMGLQLIGARGNDLGLLQLAEAYHEATDWPGRVRPDLG
jgi:amidase